MTRSSGNIAGCDCYEPGAGQISNMTCQRQREQPRLLLSDPARQTRRARSTAAGDLGALGCAGPHILANSEPSPLARSHSLGTRTAGPRSRGAAGQREEGQGRRRRRRRRGRHVGMAHRGCSREIELSVEFCRGGPMIVFLDDLGPHCSLLTEVMELGRK